MLAEVGRNLAVWVCDYAYALRWQAVGVLRRHEPRTYRLPDAAGPAIVLIPGIYERWTFMLPVADALRETGHDVHAVTDLRYNGGTIEDMAGLVDGYLRREGIGRCVLVAHSKGGLVGKRVLARHNGSAVVQGLVGVNTLFSGSWLAR